MNLIDQLRQVGRDTQTLPGITGEFCVHALIDTATCRACVDACPHGAWQLSEELLGIDAERCDGCQLCVAACPEGAITADRHPVPRRCDGDTVAMIACERSGLPDGEGVLPCLHAIDETRLLKLWMQGATRLYSCAGDCTGCDRSSPTDLRARLARVNGLLDSRHLHTLRHEPLTPQQWLDRFGRSTSNDDGPAIGRRQFLRRTLGGMAASSLTEASGDETGHRRGAPDEGLPPPRVGERIPFRPLLDPLSCNACGACIRLCPHAVITEPDGAEAGAPSYRIDTRGCTGCGICVDVCDQGAVSILAWSAYDGRDTLQLHESRCRSCGNPFMVPARQAEASCLCRICQQRDHQSLLFQVLD